MKDLFCKDFELIRSRIAHYKRVMNREYASLKTKNIAAALLKADEERFDALVAVCDAQEG